MPSLLVMSADSSLLPSIHCWAEPIVASSIVLLAGRVIDSSMIPGDVTL